VDVVRAAGERLVDRAIARGNRCRAVDVERSALGGCDAIERHAIARERRTFSLETDHGWYDKRV
jgi:hypothetical protein